jgi:hypothetical protein
MKRRLDQKFSPSTNKASQDRHVHAGDHPELGGEYSTKELASQIITIGNLYTTYFTSNMAIRTGLKIMIQTCQGLEMDIYLAYARCCTNSENREWCTVYTSCLEGVGRLKPQ